MADVKISELTALTSPDGAEELVVNDGGTTKKITIDNLFNQDIDVTGTVTADGFLIETGTASNAGTIISTDSTVLFSMVDSGGSSQFRNTNGAYSIRTGGDAGTSSNTKPRINVQSDGGIDFYDTAGTAIKMHWDASAESLGIGTSSPATLLDTKAASNSINDWTITAQNSAGSAAIEIGGYGYNHNLYHRFHINDVEKTRIAATGALLHGTTTAGSAGEGDIVVAGGVYLGGTGAANKLDDYEEGSVTLTTADATTGGTTGITTTGYYTKVGRLVTIYASLSNITTTGMTAANGLRLQGLPFLSENTISVLGTCKVDNVSFQSTRTYAWCTVSKNASYMSFQQGGNGISDTNIDVSDINSGISDIQFSITYSAV